MTLSIRPPPRAPSSFLSPSSRKEDAVPDPQLVAQTRRARALSANIRRSGPDFVSPRYLRPLPLNVDPDRSGPSVLSPPRAGAFASPARSHASPAALYQQPISPRLGPGMASPADSRPMPDIVVASSSSSAAAQRNASARPSRAVASAAPRRFPSPAIVRPAPLQLNSPPALTAAPPPPAAPPPAARKPVASILSPRSQGGGGGGAPPRSSITFDEEALRANSGAAATSSGGGRGGGPFAASAGRSAVNAVEQWSAEQVQEWVRSTCQLPEYAGNFSTIRGKARRCGTHPCCAALPPQTS